MSAQTTTQQAPSGSGEPSAARDRATLRKANNLLRLFAWVKIPMIGYVRPRIITQDDERVVVKIPLSRRTKNHHGTMYFGGLAVGADLAAGLVAMQETDRLRRSDGTRISFVFKDVEGRFLRRPDGDVHFTTTTVPAVRELVATAARSGQREELAVPVTCTVPSVTGDEPVAEFTLTISLKRRDPTA